MKIIRNLNLKTTSSPSLALTIGNFDGVHLGHQKIINEVKKIAAEKKISSAILTFEPHPTSLFKPNQAKDFRVTSLAQKLQIFIEAGIDTTAILSFNQKLSELSATDFIQEILVKTLNVKHLVVGYDFIFGKNREGNFELLKKESKNSEFDLTEILEVKAEVKDEISAEVKDSERIFSSSMIRKFLREGNVASANKILGRNFTIAGLVNEGKQLASQLGFPTMNLKAKPHIIKPKFGVYKTTTFIPHLNQKFPSITNFGIKPTILETSEPIYETHIPSQYWPDFSRKVYGKKIVIEFLDFVREEIKFNSLEELKKQIGMDLVAVGS